MGDLDALEAFILKCQPEIEDWMSAWSHARDNDNLLFSDEREVYYSANLHPLPPPPPPPREVCGKLESRSCVQEGRFSRWLYTVNGETFETLDKKVFEKMEQIVDGGLVKLRIENDGTRDFIAKAYKFDPNDLPF